MISKEDHKDPFSWIIAIGDIVLYRETVHHFLKFKFSYFFSIWGKTRVKFDLWIILHQNRAKKYPSVLEVIELFCMAG